MWSSKVYYEWIYDVRETQKQIERSSSLPLQERLLWPSAGLHIQRGRTKKKFRGWRDFVEVLHMLSVSVCIPDDHAE